jgi:Gpi18-like mannosyltransferase
VVLQPASAHPILTRTSIISEPARTPSHAPELASQQDRSALWIIAAGLVALTLKLAIAFNTLGSNDVVTFYSYGKALSEHNLEWTYQHRTSFNHPPLTAYYLRAISQLEHTPSLRENGLTFPFLLRLPGILADLVVVIALLHLARNDTRVRIPSWALALFALSPVSLMVSGFHGNTDSVMVMFLVLAAIFTLRNKPVLAGLFLALSCQIKIIPLLLFPIFFFFWSSRHRLIPFLLPFVSTSALLWFEPLTRFPLLFFRNVLSYGSFWGIWGITYWLRLTNLPQFSAVSFLHFPLLQSFVITALKALIIVSILIIAWRRRNLDERAFLDSVSYGWIVFFVFSPGVCAQYMIWLAPFILMLSPTFYAWLLATSSIFVFFFYNVTAGGLPWYIAISTNQLNRIWTPWTVWPWIVLIAGMVLLWRNAIAKDPQLRLVSLRQA